MVRYLLHAVAGGAIALAARPATGAVILGDLTTTPATSRGVFTISAVDNSDGGFPLAVSSDAYALLTRDVGAAHGPDALPIVRAANAPGGAATLPEPATWGLMLLGFGGLSFALRSRARVGERIRFS